MPNLLQTNEGRRLRRPSVGGGRITTTAAAVDRWSADIFGLARFDFLVEVVVAHVGDVDPRVGHLVDRAIAPANPLSRVGVALLGGRVVVPRGDLQDRALRKQRRVVVLEHVVVHPVELEVRDIAQHLLLAVGQDGFDHHRLAAQVHVRLEVLDPAGLAHDVEVLADVDGVRGDVEVAVAAGDAAVEREHRAVLGLLTLRVEVDAELHFVGDVFAGGAVVDVPADFRSGKHELAGVRAHATHPAC